MGHHNKARNQYREPKQKPKTPHSHKGSKVPHSIDIGSRLKMLGLSKPKKQKKEVETNA
jgi:hypothetical protein